VTVSASSRVSRVKETVLVWATSPPGRLRTARLTSALRRAARFDGRVRTIEAARAVRSSESAATDLRSSTRGCSSIDTSSLLVGRVKVASTAGSAPGSGAAGAGGGAENTGVSGARSQAGAPQHAARARPRAALFGMITRTWPAPSEVSPDNTNRVQPGRPRASSPGGRQGSGGW